MKITLKINFIILLLIFPVFAQNNIENEIQAGLNFLRSENFEEARLKFSQILNAEPDNFQARSGLAIALIGIEKFPEASREIAKLLAREPKNKLLLDMAAQSFWQQKRYTEAESVLKRRVLLDEVKAENYVLLGDVLDILRKTPEAVKAYKKAVELKPESIDYRYALGSLYWKLFDFENAQNVFLEILKLKPGEPRASFNLGDIYLRNRDAKNAVLHLETAVKAFPEEYDTQFSLGRAYLLLKNYSKAVEHLEKAVKLRPEISEGHYQLAVALRKIGKIEESNAAFQQSKKLNSQKLESENVYRP